MRRWASLASRGCGCRAHTARSALRNNPTEKEDQRPLEAGRDESDPTLRGSRQVRVLRAALGQLVTSKGTEGTSGDPPVCSNQGQPQPARGPEAAEVHVQLDLEYFQRQRLCKFFG